VPAAPFSPAVEPLVARIHAALEHYATPRHLGRVWAGIGVVLDRREGVVLHPDITFVMEGRESIVTDCVWGPPDMVLEIAAPPGESPKPETRVALFSAYGVREFWLIHREQREVALLQLAHGGVRRRALLNDHTPIRTPLFPDFDVSLGQLLG